LGILQTQKLESIGVLAGGIAHDFNNMLMVVLGNTDLALANISEETPVYKRLTDIRTVSIRAADLCRQLLAYAGKGRYLVEPVNLSSMVEEMTSMFDVSISKKVFLNYNLAKWLPPIEADASQIRQVIMNLVINASEAIGEKSGAIYISTSVMEYDREYLVESDLNNDLKPGYYVCLEIADTGSGMDKETTDKIFDPFFTTKYTGRGLGLAAVLGIVRGHKGGIKVYSEPGKGTTFKLLFPVADEVTESIATVQRKEVDTWKGSGTVLLVDDDESVRSLSSLLLEHLGFDVLLAADGRIALKIFSEHRHEIRCVILDLTMPRMGGEETFRELRRIDPQARIIMSSGYNEQDVVHRFIGKGLSGFIQKPYQLKSLAQTLMKILDEAEDGAGDN
jgi:CheY-like chemotaxis protein